METNKLMTPLFYGDMFNREGHRMRAALEREISNGSVTYRLWRSAGKPDLEYPRADNDKYVLQVEINGYLAPLRMTDFALTYLCGFEPAAMELYGGKEKRGAWIDSLRESGGFDAVNAALAKEQEEIERYGRDPARQTDYIQSVLDEHVSIYQKAKESGGQTFPDFIGALVLDELAVCQELSGIFKEKRQRERAERAARVEAEERAYCEAENQKAEQAVSEATQIIRNGGVLKNVPVRFFRSRYDARSYSIVNYLMRLYHVEVPLRTQGWVNNKLTEVTIQNGRCSGFRYLRAKNGSPSEKFYSCMNELIRAVAEQKPEQMNEEAVA